MNISKQIAKDICKGLEKVLVTHEWADVNIEAIIASHLEPVVLADPRQLTFDDYLGSLTEHSPVG